jgi:hypothetical protein
MYVCASGFGVTATSSGAKKFHDKSTIHINDRKRAKSYPSDGRSSPIPLLELPKQPRPIEEEDESEVSLIYTECVNY